MRSVELLSKDSFKDSIKEIVRKLQIRCRDQELLNDVLKKAGKNLDKDLSLSPVERSRFGPKKGPSMKKKQSISSNKVSAVHDKQSKQQLKRRDAGSDESLDSISVSSSSSSSGLSSVDVSSVES